MLTLSGLPEAGACLSSSRSKKADGLQPFCYIDFEARRNELQIHTLAAYSEQVTMIKTQSLFDLH